MIPPTRLGVVGGPGTGVRGPERRPEVLHDLAPLAKCGNTSRIAEPARRGQR